MSASISRFPLPQKPAARSIDWRGLARRALPFVVLVLAGVLGVAAVALASSA